jgi:WXXGXW repeat (2 copies)
MKAMGKHVLFAAILVLGGCGTKQDTAVQTASTADDPAAANLATVPDAQQVTQPPPQQAAPTPQQAYSQPPPQEAPPVQQDSDGSESVEYAPEPPPPLPEYTQPECPGENYIWTPGTWDYASTGYYWVPGVWVMAPFVGALWTPSYWDYESTRYRWHQGYWGPHIGFYGGINYGYGYVGRGYEGGYWNQNVFAYNRAVTNVNVTIVHNVYNHSVSVSGFGNRVSYNGGRGGINARPIPAELAVQRERPIPPVAAQVEHIRQAAGNREQFAAVNHGRPQVAVAPRPLATSYREPARERPVQQQEARPATPAHVEQPRAQQIHPQQARPEPARPEVRQAQPAARMPQNEMRPVAPGRAEPRQEARPVQQQTPRQQEARPVQPRQEPQRQEPRPVQQQPRPDTRPAQAQHERPAPATAAAPRQENHGAPAARPAQHPAEQHPAGKPEEKKPEEKKKQ